MSLTLRDTIVFFFILFILAFGASRSSAQTDISTIVVPAQKSADRVAADHPRPAALIPLYVSLASLQAFDIDSTIRAMSHGATEGNPLVSSVTGSPATMLAVKAGMMAGVVWSAERLRKDHPKTAVMLMVVLNSAYATVVAHNYDVTRRSR